MPTPQNGDTITTVRQVTLTYRDGRWIPSPGNAFDGDYDHLNNKPTIPTKVSELSNDAALVNETMLNQALQSRATMQQVNAAVGTAVSDRPTAAAVTGEITAAIEGKADKVDTPTNTSMALAIADAAAGKANTSHTHAATDLSGVVKSLNLLSGLSGNIDATGKLTVFISSLPSLNGGNLYNVKADRIGYTYDLVDPVDSVENDVLTYSNGKWINRSNNLYIASRSQPTGTEKIWVKEPDRGYMYSGYECVDLNRPTVRPITFYQANSMVSNTSTGAFMPELGAVNYGIQQNFFTFANGTQRNIIHGYLDGRWNVIQLNARVYGAVGNELLVGDDSSCLGIYGVGQGLLTSINFQALSIPAYVSTARLTTGGATKIRAAVYDNTWAQYAMVLDKTGDNLHYSEPTNGWDPFSNVSNMRFYHAAGSGEAKALKDDGTSVVLFGADEKYIAPDDPFADIQYSETFNRFYTFKEINVSTDPTVVFGYFDGNNNYAWVTVTLVDWLTRAGNPISMWSGNFYLLSRWRIDPENGLLWYFELANNHYFVKCYNANTGAIIEQYDVPVPINTTTTQSPMSRVSMNAKALLIAGNYPGVFIVGKGFTAFTDFQDQNISTFKFDRLLTTTHCLLDDGTVTERITGGPDYGDVSYGYFKTATGVSKNQLWLKTSTGWANTGLEF